MTPRSDPEDPQGTNTWELEGLRHRELSLMAQQKSLDAVLHSHVVAMVGLLNLYLDGTLGYSWRRALEIAAKSEGHGTRHA